MTRSSILWLGLTLAMASPAVAGNAATLRGSPASMLRQNEVAKENDFTFLRNADQVRNFVDEGRLVPIEGNEDYGVARGVTFPFARPELRTFLERLSEQYRSSCGEQLVVTSLTRPLANQPGNAHPLSVHPAGMAVDLRVSRDAQCRSWLEGTLLSLERNGVLDVTRERQPPHYHVAVFPGPYMEHVQRQETAALAAAAPAPTVPSVASSFVPARVKAPVAAEPEAGQGLKRFVMAVLFSVALMYSVGRGQRHGPGRWS